MNALPRKLGLAAVSVAFYVLVSLLADRTGPLSELLGGNDVAVYLSGLVFGACVLALYVASPARRMFRVLVLCLVSAGIYRLAIELVVNGPFQQSELAAFALAGASSALVAALAVVWLAPRPFRWMAPSLALVAGAAGGAAFLLEPPIQWLDPLIVGHLAWQLLVCAALHFGLAPARPASLP